MGYQLIMLHGRSRPQAVATSRSIESAESWGMPLLPAATICMPLIAALAIIWNLLGH
jgi:hypothetical protein